MVNHKQDENVRFHLHLREENGESNNSAGVQMNAHWYFHSTKDLCFTFVNPVFEARKDKLTKEYTPLNEFCGVKNKIKYIVERIIKN